MPAPLDAAAIALLTLPEPTVKVEPEFKVVEVALKELVERESDESESRVTLLRK